MSKDNWGKVWTQREAYVKNSRRFPREELRKLAGQWVGWSADGSCIVAHHQDLQQALQMVDEAGVGRMDVVFDWEPEEDVDTIL